MYVHLNSVSAFLPLLSGYSLPFHSFLHLVFSPMVRRTCQSQSVNPITGPPNEDHGLLQGTTDIDATLQCGVDGQRVNPRRTRSDLGKLKCFQLSVSDNREQEKNEPPPHWTPLAPPIWLHQPPLGPCLQRESGPRMMVNCMSHRKHS